MVLCLTVLPVAIKAGKAVIVSYRVGPSTLKTLQYPAGFTKTPIPEHFQPTSELIQNIVSDVLSLVVEYQCCNAIQLITTSTATTIPQYLGMIAQVLIFLPVQFQIGGLYLGLLVHQVMHCMHDTEIYLALWSVRPLSTQMILQSLKITEHGVELV